MRLSCPRPRRPRSPGALVPRGRRRRALNARPCRSSSHLLPAPVRLGAHAPSAPSTRERVRVARDREASSPLPCVVAGCLGRPQRVLQLGHPLLKLEDVADPGHAHPVSHERPGGEEPTNVGPAVPAMVAPAPCGGDHRHRVETSQGTCLAGSTTSETRAPIVGNSGRALISERRCAYLPGVA